MSVAEALPEKNVPFDLDIGFRVLKLDSSNMTDSYYDRSVSDQMALAGMEETIKPDRTGLDLLFGCLLEFGLTLDRKYTEELVDGCTVFDYDNGALVACFDHEIPGSVVVAMAERQPKRAVFRESGFADSACKMQAGQFFELLSPETRVKVL